MRRTRIKFCGMTRLDDVRCAVDLGVDAIGMIFVPGSKRAIDLPLAARLAQAIPPLVTRVALFLNPEAAAVQAVLREVPLDLLQFHGSESPDFCASFERPYVKALAMGDDVDVGFEMSRYARARGVLLDAHRSGEQGGRGEAFDWSRIPAQWAPRILLAGGLRPDTVAHAIRTVRPFAVDVSSGIESAPGVKSERLMQHFVAEVERASRESGPA